MELGPGAKTRASATQPLSGHWAVENVVVPGNGTGKKVPMPLFPPQQERGQRAMMLAPRGQGEAGRSKRPLNGGPLSKMEGDTTELSG